MPGLNSYLATYFLVAIRLGHGRGMTLGLLRNKMLPLTVYHLLLKLHHDKGLLMTVSLVTPVKEFIYPELLLVLMSVSLITKNYQPGLIKLIGNV